MSLEQDKMKDTNDKMEKECKCKECKCEKKEDIASKVEEKGSVLEEKTSNTAVSPEEKAKVLLPLSHHWTFKFYFPDNLIFDDKDAKFIIDMERAMADYNSEDYKLLRLNKGLAKAIWFNIPVWDSQV